MSHRYIVAGSVVLSLIALSLALIAYTTRPKIGYVNNEALLSGYNGVKEGNQLFEKKLQTWQANVDTLGSELKREVDSYEQSYQQLSNRERALKEELLNRKKGDLDSYKRAIDQKAEEEQRRMSQAIFNQINSYIKNYGRQHGYKYIFGVTNDGSILYAPEGDDLTKEILKALNHQYEGQ